MAKSIRITEIGTQRDQLVAPLPRGSFWEDWFYVQSACQNTQTTLDEHTIWERAVNFEILAMEEKKY